MKVWHCYLSKKTYSLRVLSIFVWKVHKSSYPTHFILFNSTEYKLQNSKSGKVQSSRWPWRCITHLSDCRLENCKYYTMTSKKKCWMLLFHISRKHELSNLSQATKWKKKPFELRLRKMGEKIRLILDLQY